MKTMTIRGVPAELAAALENEKKRRGTSLNRTVLGLMREALGLSHTGPRSNGLRRLAGAWSEDEYQEFERATDIFNRVDKEVWR